MSYDHVNYEDVEAVAGGMHFLRDPLDTDNLGVTVLEAPAGWEGKEHDHAEADHEEVYLLLEGAATVVIDGETVELAPGDAVRVDPGARRQIRTGDQDSVLVLAGADR